MSALGRLTCRMTDEHKPVTEAFVEQAYSQVLMRTVTFNFSFLVCRRCETVLEEHSWMEDDDGLLDT
jgi:hypothetical protein